MDNGTYYTNCKLRLGKGSFGAVYQGFHKLTNDPVAIKQIERGDIIFESAQKELVGLKKLQHHKNIVQYLDSYGDRLFLWVIIEFCDRGDLESYLTKAKPNLDRKLQIMTECASAISFMHNLNPPVIHRDIKLNNILLKSVGPDDVTVKICDFGVAKIFEEGENSEFMKTDTGTMPFMAPEFLLRVRGKLQYTKAVDTYALGLVFQVMLNYGTEGKDVFPHAVGESLDYVTLGMTMMNRRERGRLFPVLFTIRPGEVHPLPELKALASRMTGFEPQDRFPMSQVLSVLESLQFKHPEDPLIDSTIEEIQTAPTPNLTKSEDPLRKLRDDIPQSLLLHAVTSLHSNISSSASADKDTGAITQEVPTITQALSTIAFYITFYLLLAIQQVWDQVLKNSGSSDKRYTWRLSCILVAFVIALGSLVSFKSTVFLGAFLVKYAVSLIQVGLYLFIIAGTIIPSVLF